MIIFHRLQPFLNLYLLQVCRFIDAFLYHVLPIESTDQRLILLIPSEQVLNCILFMFEVLQHGLLNFFSHCEVLYLRESSLLIVLDFVFCAEDVMLVQVGECSVWRLVFERDEFVHQSFRLGQLLFWQDSRHRRRKVFLEDVEVIGFVEFG